MFSDPLIRLRSVVQTLFGRARIDGEMEEELRAHIQNRADDLERGGLGRREALRRARLEFGGYQKFKEQSREAMGTHFFETLAQDVRYAIRTLRKAPGFAAVAIFTLALGIGANTTLFSVVNGVLLNPLPYRQPNQLVTLWWDRTPGGQHSAVPYLNFLDWQRENSAFSSMGAYLQDKVTLSGTGDPEPVADVRTSANFFDLLGVKPILGRMLRPEEDQIGASPVVLIGDGLWNRKFASSPDVLGKSITLDGTAYTIVGVVPGKSPIFTAADVFTPLGQFDDATFRDRRVTAGVVAIGRMKPGVTLAQARADMDSVARNLSAAYPDADKDTGIFVNPLKDDITGDVARTLFILLGAVGFVLLIACANVANLLLARSIGRSREFAIRAALGATQGRVVRQLLTESVLLSAAGGLLGLLLAVWGTRAAIAAIPQALPRADEIGLDGKVLVFTVGISLLVGIMFGLVPALRTAKPALNEALNSRGRGSTGAHHRTQNLFVVGEMALSLVLLAGAGLMVRTLVALADVNPGFDPQHVLTFAISPAPARLTTAAQIRQTYRELTAQFQAAPGVVAASPLVGALPLAGDSLVPFWIEGHAKPSSAKEMTRAQWYATAPTYLKVMGISLQRGRFFSEQDTETTPFVVVIDDGFARTYFPGEDPIGKRLNLAIVDITGAEIVGVVGHVKQAGLGATGILDQRGQIYFSMTQLPDKVLPLVGRASLFAVRAIAEPNSVIEGIRAASRNYDSRQVLFDLQPMSQVVSDSIAAQRFTMIVLVVFALVALILSAVGIFGVISYLASQRTQEIGIRMALGAQRGDMARMVLGQGMRVALLGVAIGLAAALGLTRLIASQLYGVGANDPLTLGTVTMLLILIALLACYLPARRAMRVDPMVALRYE